MNTDYSNYPNRSDREENRGFRTHRSERYRHPEAESRYRFDDYGSPARGGYGNEGNAGTWGNQGNEMGGSRNISYPNMFDDTYRPSRNFGSMGSYGGAQGYGDTRGGYPSQRESGHPYDSGMGYSSRGSYSPERRRSYGYQSDYDSHGTGYTHDTHPDLYGSDKSRRFRGSGQSRYDFDRDNYNRGSGSYRGSERSYGSSSGYSGSQGSYMGSGYSRTSGSDYDTGDYGTLGSYDRGSSSMNYGDPYGKSSFSGSRHTDYPNDTYARDTDNTRIQHRDSDYDYDPNHSFDVHKDPYYIASHNRGRTWDQEHDRDRSSDRF